MPVRVFTTLALAAALASMTAPPLFAQEVGKVALVHVFGYETPPAERREPLYVRDAVVANTMLETVRDGRIDVRFVDDTKLIVGPGSQVRVDQFVFDPSRGAGEATLDMSKGVMRFITGRMASQAYRVRTPTATLGVRDRLCRGGGRRWRDARVGAGRRSLHGSQRWSGRNRFRKQHRRHDRRRRHRRTDASIADACPGGVRLYR